MSLLLAVQGGAFDPATMAAMKQPPELVREVVSVVVSGMTPPNTFIP